MTAPEHWIGAADPRLPERIRHVHRPCPGLWFAGDPSVLGRGLRVGIVGSRHPRAEAAAIATRIAGDVARVGGTIVSGLAIGIDGIAHEQACARGSSTIGVVAGGLASIHPRRNRAIARRIAGSATPDGVRAGAHDGALGVMVSEYGAGVEDSHAYRFQERNRIIAALSDYVVIVQATMGSGSMGTARHAIDLGVPIGIVPSAPDDECYSGGLALIHDGADAVIDGRSLFLRLELHGVMDAGFSAAAMAGAVVDPDVPGGWIGGEEYGDLQLQLPDHPLASFVRIPRGVEEIAELAGLGLLDARRMLLDLEEDGRVVHVDDGTWIATDVAAEKAGLRVV